MAPPTGAASETRPGVRVTGSGPGGGRGGGARRAGPPRHGPGDRMAGQGRGTGGRMQVRGWMAAVALAGLAGLGPGCTRLADPVPVADPFRTLRNPAPETTQGPPATAPTPIGPGPARPRPVQGFVRYGAETPAPRIGAPVQTTTPTPGPGAVSLNLVEADLRDVIRTLVQDGLGGNFLIDPGVQGAVTFSTTRPLAPSQILPVLEEILALHDAAVIVTPDLYRIVPRGEAGVAAPLIDARAAGSRGLTLRVTPLNFVRAADLAEVLESFAPASGAIRIDPTHNLVFSVGTEAEQATIFDLIATLDVDYLAGRSFALTPLAEAQADAVVDELNAIFAGPQQDPGGGPIRFLAIERMNAVLTISSDRTYLAEAVAWMRRLDAGSDDAERLFVYDVRNRRASDLAVLLGDIFGAQVTGAVAEAPPLAPGLAAETGAGDGLGTGAGGDFGGTPPGDPGTPTLRAQVEPLAPAPGFGPAAGPSSGVSRIVADEASNTVIALATPDGARAVEGALRRLDIQPLQVQIEATLAEVTLTDQLEFGVRWFFQAGDTRTSLTDALTGATGAVFPGFNFVYSAVDAQVTLSALDDITNVRVLSSPTLMVLDNQVARLQVGDQVPVQTRTAVSIDDPEAPLVNDIEFRDTGVILTVRPTVNAGGLVVLEVRQEVSDVVETSTSGIDSPTIAQRVLESTIAVQSGETVAMGGLIRDSVDRGRQGIPILADIPVAGALFGTRGRSVERTELLVLITPRVVRDQQGARRVTDELRAKLTGIYAPPVPGTVPDPLSDIPGVPRLSGL